MTIGRTLRSLWRHPLAGMRDVGYGDLLLAVLAGTFAVYTVMYGPHRNGGVAAAIGAQLMTAPLLVRRRAPVATALFLGAAAVFNALVFGKLVRCGPGLPTLFITGFALGHLRRGRAMWTGYVGLAVSGVSQSLSDPNLTWTMIGPLLPLTAGFMGAGRLLASRQAMVATLRTRNEELRAQREANARLAVEADRARIAEDLDVSLRQRLAEMSQAAGAAVSDFEEDRARAAFGRIEAVGRETLTHMREVVGSMRPREDTTPAPVLAQLDDLLSRATTADTRLVVEGKPTSLPAGVELSGYRIVEHLLVALEDAPDARVDVVLTFAADALDITVRGPAARKADRIAAIAAARERVAVHGGTLETTTTAGKCEAVVRLPLIVAHA